jgi:hypothetical protein
MLTKVEMENIWHNKPIDYLKSYNKKMKGSKMYRVKLTSINYNLGPTEEFEVRGSSKLDAEITAKNEYVKKYNTRPDAWRINCFVK